MLNVAFSLLILASQAGLITEQQYEYATSQAYNSSQPYVIATIVKSSTLEQKVGCVVISDLIEAVTREHAVRQDIGSKSKALDYIRHNKSHIFSFKKESALLAVSFQNLENNNKEACRILESGMIAVRQDRTMNIVSIPLPTSLE